MTEIKVKLTLIEEMLGTAASEKDVHDKYIATKIYGRESIIPKNVDELMDEEVAAIVETEANRGKTIFSRDEDDNPIIWDYQIKGFFKDACSMLRKVPGTESAKIKAFKKEIDGLIFVYPRQIPIKINGKIGDCQRPLRASTAQGERVTLANSETVPAGSSMIFTIKCLSDAHKDAVLEWLYYGENRGLGAWRNSGKGKFYIDILS